MTPLSQNAISTFALISANVGNDSIHINVLLHVAKQPKSQVETALIELMTHELIQYDIPTQRIFIVKARKKHEKRTRKVHGE